MLTFQAYLSLQNAVKPTTNKNPPPFTSFPTSSFFEASLSSATSDSPPKASFPFSKLHYFNDQPSPHSLCPPDSGSKEIARHGGSYHQNESLLSTPLLRSTMPSPILPTPISTYSLQYDDHPLPVILPRLPQRALRSSQKELPQQNLHRPTNCSCLRILVPANVTPQWPPNLPRKANP